LPALVRSEYISFYEELEISFSLHQPNSCWHCCGMAKIAGEHWVSAKRKKDALSFPLTVEAKIDLFEERIQGWQISIADQCYRGVLDNTGNRISSSIPHSGFGVLYMLLSYFEMIAKYEAGDLSEVSAIWFKEGIKSVYPELTTRTERILVKFYKGARCGLYHAGLTSKYVFISGDVASIEFDSISGMLVINPGDMIDRVANHLKIYCQQLRDPAQTLLRSNFEKKFDADILPQIQ
ncbi:MAG: hypothetical protein JWM68_2204, partial [Verrucomicrobiales bacterium]|nr:hypothetical protein [Verrucomicrobiales bacterium]